MGHCYLANAPTAFRYNQNPANIITIIHFLKRIAIKYPKTDIHAAHSAVIVIIYFGVSLAAPSKGPEKMLFR